MTYYYFSSKIDLNLTWVICTNSKPKLVICQTYTIILLLRQTKLQQRLSLWLQSLRKRNEWEIEKEYENNLKTSYDIRLRLAVCSHKQDVFSGFCPTAFTIFITAERQKYYQRRLSSLVLQNMINMIDHGLISILSHINITIIVIILKKYSGRNIINIEILVEISILGSTELEKVFFFLNIYVSVDNIHIFVVCRQRSAFASAV